MDSKKRKAPDTPAPEEAPAPKEQKRSLAKCELILQQLEEKPDVAMKTAVIVRNCGQRPNGDNKRTFNHILKTLQHLDRVEYHARTWKLKLMPVQPASILVKYDDSQSTLDIRLLRALPLHSERIIITTQGLVAKLHPHLRPESATFRQNCTLANHVLETLRVHNVVSFSEYDGKKAWFML